MTRAYRRWHRHHARSLRTVFLHNNRICSGRNCSTGENSGGGTCHQSGANCTGRDALTYRQRLPGFAGAQGIAVHGTVVRRGDVDRRYDTRREYMTQGIQQRHLNALCYGSGSTENPRQRLSNRQHATQWPCSRTLSTPTKLQGR